ncbi:MAG: deoxyguanosinetriphosphate triphosphohydrolase, partial [Shewanella oncorhynchi]
LAQIEQDLDDMRKTLNQGSELSLGFSFGIAPFEADWYQSFKTADHAMYEQKRAKKKAIKALETFAVKAQ